MGNLDKYDMYPDETTEGERITQIYGSILWLLMGTVSKEDINFIIEFLDDEKLKELMPDGDLRKGKDITVRFLREIERM